MPDLACTIRRRSKPVRSVRHSDTGQASRQAAALGGVLLGSGVGKRIKHDPSVPVQRLWLAEGVPGIVTVDQLSTVLEQAFDEVEMVHQRRRGACKDYTWRCQQCSSTFGPNRQQATRGRPTSPEWTGQSEDLGCCMFTEPGRSSLRGREPSGLTAMPNSIDYMR